MRSHSQIFSYTSNDTIDVIVKLDLLVAGVTTSKAAAEGC